MVIFHSHSHKEPHIREQLSFKSNKHSHDSGNEGRGRGVTFVGGRGSGVEVDGGGTL
jgi:hypothetical protein